MHTETLVAELRTLLGAEQVLTDPDILHAAAIDTWPLRLVQRAVGGQPAPGPRCVVRPNSRADVSAALAYAYERGIVVVPRGGGTGVLGGAEAPPGSIVLDLTRLDQIIGLDETNHSVTAEAGVRLERLEGWLNERGYVSGHYPQSIRTAQLGGLVATRSSGQLSTRYGSIEDLLLGFEAVLPDGAPVRLSPAPRRAAGPDLRQLFVGSEGVFGVLTEVTLKVFPKPASTWRGAFAVPSMVHGLDMMRGVVQAGWRPAVLRLYDPVETARSFGGSTQGGQCILLCAAEGPTGLPELERAAIKAAARDGGATELGSQPVDAWFEHRNDVSALLHYVQAGTIVDIVDVGAGWDAVARVYQAVLDALHGNVPELVMASAHASHAYPQGTNLYFTVGAQPPRDAQAVERVYRALWSAAMNAVLANGGSISHHHGIGKLRAAWLEQELGSSYAMLRRLKAAFDPRGTMNPGTLLP